MMYCKKCGKELGENEQYCSTCGEPSVKMNRNQTDTGRKENEQMEINRPGNRDYVGKIDKTSAKDQPTKALIVEGIGALFFIYLLILNGSSDYTAQSWLQENGAGVFLIGLIFVVVSYFMLKKYKKNHNLHGIGYAGYLVSCIAAIIMAVMLIWSILIIRVRLR